MRRENEYNEYNISQQPAIELLKAIGYQYIPAKQAEVMRGTIYKFLLRDVLEQKLKELNSFTYKGVTTFFSEQNIRQAIQDLDEPLTDGLVKTNEKILETLLLGRSYKEKLPDRSKKSFSLRYIHWDHPANNVFHVVEELVVERMNGQDTVRPDIVLFVNGIPFGVIECKKSLALHKKIG
jgi:type I restriction enzyme R subunit